MGENFQVEISHNSSLSGDSIMTPSETRGLLQESGFVRVDGLRTGPEMVDKSIIRAVGQGGVWDHHNGVYAVLTTHRELWIRSRSTGDEQNLTSALELLAPNGKGLFVPCSHGDWPSAHDLLARVANPDYTPV